MMENRKLGRMTGKMEAQEMERKLREFNKREIEQKIGKMRQINHDLKQQVEDKAQSKQRIERISKNSIESKHYTFINKEVRPKIPCGVCKHKY